MRRLSAFWLFLVGRHLTLQSGGDIQYDALNLLGGKIPRHRPICFFYWSSCRDCVEEGAPSVCISNDWGTLGDLEV